MSNYSIDAIKIAKAIQKDELTILRGKEFKMRVKIKKNKERSDIVSKPGKKYTLNGLGSRMDRFETKLDQIGDALFEFIKTANTRFDNLEKDVKDINTRLDRVENRLDYNGLKKIPENI